MEGIRIIKINISFEKLIETFDYCGDGASKVAYKNKKHNFVLKAPAYGRDEDIREILLNPYKIPETPEELSEVANELDMYTLAAIYGQFYAELFYYNELVKKSVQNKHCKLMLQMLAKTYCAYITSDGVLVLKQEKADRVCDNYPSSNSHISGHWRLSYNIKYNIKNSFEQEYFNDLLYKASTKMYNNMFKDVEEKIGMFFKSYHEVNDCMEYDYKIGDIRRCNIGMFEGKIKIFDYGIIGCFDINDYAYYGYDYYDEEDY